MRWRDGERSENVEDRRRMQPAGLAIGGGLGTILIVLLASFLGVDPRPILNQNQRAAARQAQQPGGPVNPVEEERKDFVAVVLKDTEDVWEKLFSQNGKTYRKPKLVLFTGRVDSACGMASTAVGPFYCPGDQKVYIDLAFYDELKTKFKAPGDFAQAYVVAHEIGHHVQNLLGISEQVSQAQRRMSKAEGNQLSVRLELQADFLAGVWAHHAQEMKQILEAGDVKAALRAATAIGDDTLQRQAQGYVVPDSFTHGTSEQRVKWFYKGLQTGDMNQGDTFKVSASDL
jgi:predicted metalloprotease